VGFSLQNRKISFPARENHDNTYSEKKNREIRLLLRIKTKQKKINKNCIYRSRHHLPLDVSVLEKHVLDQSIKKY
jgi:hypothetical protein